MGLKKNIVEFYYGEAIEFSVLAKERDGSVLLDPANATFELKIAADTDTALIYTFDSSPQVQVLDIPTALFGVLLAPADYSSLVEGTEYRWDIYTTPLGGTPMHQAGGILQLQPAADA